MSKVLQLRHIFGFRSDISSPFHFADENNVVFSAGHNIVIHNIEDKTQTFVSGQNNSLDITAIDVHMPKKLIAIAEKTEKCAAIQIFDLLSEKKKRKKIIHCSDIQSKEIISLKFSFDSKYLLAISGAPDWAIMNFQREKVRIIQIIRNQTISTMPFYCGSYCRSDTNLIVCTGHKVLKFYKSEQSELKPITINLGKRDPSDYTAHCWDNYHHSSHEQSQDKQCKRLLVCTDNGEILVFDGTEFRGILDTGYGVPIFSIIAYSKGFVVGCDNGMLIAYERNTNHNNDIKEMYKKINKLSIFNNECIGITSLCIPPSEEQLACVTSNNQIYSINLTQIDSINNNNDEENCDNDFAKLLLTSFHYKGIYGIDMCIRKSYLVSCGYDRSVKIWNWNDKKMIISRVFAEDPLCVSMHPSGLQIIVGFADKLRLMNILMDDIKMYKDFSIKGCTQVKFSNGGQYFAAINASTVQIYQTYTFNNIATLRGHTSKVTSIWWHCDDSLLITASTDNSVLVWNINNNIRTQEHQHKGCSYNCAVLNKNKKLLYCTGSDNTIKIISDGKIQNSYDTKETQINCLELDNIKNNYLFASDANKGDLIVFELLDNGNALDFKHQITYKMHNQCITQMIVSNDNSMLITVANDGCICLFDIRQPKHEKETEEKENNNSNNSLSWAEEILVSKSDLEEKLLEIETLKTKVNDLRLHNEFEIKTKETNYNEKLQKVNDKFTKELNYDKNKYNALRMERDEMQNGYEETLLSLSQKHEESLQQIENYHKLKIKSEKRRYNDLLLKLNNLEMQWNTETTQRENTYNNETDVITEEYNQKIDNEKLEIEKANMEIKDLKNEFNEIKVLLENDADKEIEDVKLKYENILKTERTQTLELRGNNGMLKREFATLQQCIKNGNTKMEKSLVEQNKLIEEINRFEKDIDGFHREINERDSTIKEKNKMIHSVEKKNQELEKFKFVLDYKIHELDRQIKPREHKITEINKQINEMNTESSKYCSDNHYLLLNVKDLKLKLKSLQNEYSQQNEINEDMINLIKVIGHQLSLIDKNKNDPNHMKNGVVNLFKQFNNSDLNNVNESETDNDQHKEFQRHRKYLERTVQGLQKKLIKDSTVFKKDSTRIIQENVALIKEINELRKEITTAKRNKNNIENTDIVHSLKKQMKENKNEIDRLLHIKNQLQSDNQ